MHKLITSWFDKAVLVKKHFAYIVTSDNMSNIELQMALGGRNNKEEQQPIGAMMNTAVTGLPLSFPIYHWFA